MAAADFDGAGRSLVRSRDPAAGSLRFLTPGHRRGSDAPAVPLCDPQIKIDVAEGLPAPGCHWGLRARCVVLDFGFCCRWAATWDSALP